MPSHVEIKSKKNLLNDFFQVDEYYVSFEKYSVGKKTNKILMSDPIRRLNFERGDAVGVLLFNVDTRSVVLVEQFRLPSLLGRRRDDPATQNGWIVEVMAGMIEVGETPERAAIRETLEETGYEIDKPELICKFLSSPGGTSERIFLYFASVSESRRSGTGKIGVGDEDIKVLPVSVNRLFEQLENGEIDDPKLAISAYWLKEHMPRIETLDPLTAEYKVAGSSGMIVGYKAGDIREVHEIDAWVNGENSDMIMDRFYGQSISARIRSMGATSEGEAILDDTIQESLRGLMGERASVDIGTVFVTESGMLSKTNDVQLIFHVAAAKGGLGKGAAIQEEHLAHCVERVLAEVEQVNNGILRRYFSNRIESVLFPMMGAGEGGLPTKTVAENMIRATVNYFNSRKNPTIKKIYFLTYRLREKNACDTVFEDYCDRKILER
jgi:nudix-type nucleoside diphosphatase (YffH/AdpP family)